MNDFKEELKDLFIHVRGWTFWRTLLMIQAGCFLFGLVVNGILIPQNFFSGGLMGIALLIRSISGESFPLSLLYILLNIPLFLLGYRNFSLRFIFVSLLGMGILSINLELTLEMEIQMEACLRLRLHQPQNSGGPRPDFSLASPTLVASRLCT